MTIPYTAMEVNAQRERYRILRVNVMTVVRMYNKVYLLLSHLPHLTPRMSAGDAQSAREIGVSQADACTLTLLDCSVLTVCWP